MLSAGTYTVTVSTGEGCQATTTGGVNNIGGLVTNISPDQDACLGVNVNLDANGGTEYEWSTGDSTALITVLPNLTTTYTVTISDATGCTEVLSTTVTVFPVPVATFVMTDDTICPGDTVTITAMGGVTYDWNTGVTADSIVVAPHVTTSYVAVPYIGPCPGSPASTTVYIDPLSPVAIASSNTTITYIDQGAQVDFSSLGSVGDVIEWDFNGNGTVDDTEP